MRTTRTLMSLVVKRSCLIILILSSRSLLRNSNDFMFLFIRFNVLLTFMMFFQINVRLIDSRGRSNSHHRFPNLNFPISNVRELNWSDLGLDSTRAYNFIIEATCTGCRLPSLNLLNHSLALIQGRN